MLEFQDEQRKIATAKKDQRDQKQHYLMIAAIITDVFSDGQSLDYAPLLKVGENDSIATIKTDK